MSNRGPEANLKDKLAATLLCLWEAQGDPLPIEHAREMSAEQIISLVHFDHARRKAQGGSNHPTNLTPRFIKPHREKTAKIDVPEIRKADRLAAEHERFRASLLRKAVGETNDDTAARRRKGRIRSAGFAKGHRPLRSRSTFEKRKAP